VIELVPEETELPSIGLPDSGDRTGKDFFAAYVNGEGIGLAIIRYHFGETAEICWLGVHPHHHHKGVGRALMARALEQAREKRCGHALCTVVTGHDAHAHTDPRYKLCLDSGFQPFFKYNENDPVHATTVLMRAL
jgi:GNAT superfamily N-acetyltransferase